MAEKEYDELAESEGRNRMEINEFFKMMSAKGYKLGEAMEKSQIPVGLLYSDENGIIIPGKYRHYKGNEYEVLYVGKHSETLEPMVVYRALYGDFGIWIRPASMWNETVIKDGVEYKRFTRIE